MLQLECKLNLDLNESSNLAKVVLQVCFYLKQFIKNKLEIPKVIVIGTKLNCTVIPAIYLYENYVKNYNYSEYDERGNRISASTASSSPLYTPLLNQITNDANLQTVSRIINITDRNAVKEMCIDILKTAKDLGIKEEVTAENLSRAYDFFEMKVLTKKSRDSLSSRTKAEAFMTLMLNPHKVRFDYEEDALGNKIYSGKIKFGTEVIDCEVDKFNSFANVFAVKTYSLTDQKKITEITDRLIEDTDRRRKGDFYTPTIWVDEAHKLMSKNLGDSWRQDSIVWDCAWGTGNLTRDYDFDDLYCSTLQQEDLTIGEKYNPFATKFQYDFLNDDVTEFEMAHETLWEPFYGTPFSHHKALEDKVNFKGIMQLYSDAVEKNITTPERCTTAYSKAIGIIKSTKLYECAPSLLDQLLDSNNKKPLVFLINPPYGASTNVKSTTLNGEAKIGTNDTLVRNLMEENKIGAASQNLYTQFIYRIDKIYKLFRTETKLGVFCPPAYITGKNASKLRKHLSLWAKESFLLQASQFANVSDGWGISFELLTINAEQRQNIKIDVKELSAEGNIITTQEKILYNMDDKQSLSDWIRRDIKKYKAIDAPQMKSALNWSNEHKLGNLVPGAYGYLVDSGNNIDENTSRVFWLSCCRGAGHGTSVLKENFDDCCSAFAARKLISGSYANWINCKDEYMVPNVDHPDYKQWEADCIVYSLFNTASNQSSLRNIDYNDKTWNIYNEFFWLSRNQMLNLSNGTYNPDIINNNVNDDVLAHAKSERFVYNKLKTVTLSQDAQDILNYATAILVNTFQHREEFAANHPEYHINTWDAGWYQIKALAKEYDKKALDQFNEMYKAFEDRMRPLVYELGFLYK